MRPCPKCGYVELPPALEAVRKYLAKRPTTPKATAADVAAALGIEQEAAAMRLLRLRAALAPQKKKR